MENACGALTGRQIIEEVNRGRISIVPFCESNISPNSYKYRLSNQLRKLTNDVFDLRSQDAYEEILIEEKGTILYPDECYLGSTLEKVGSDYYVGLITGRSSVGRKFITNHITSSLVEQGFYGTITLEITVHKPTIIYPNILFGHIMWFPVAGEATYYEGEYQNQSCPTLSKIHKEIS